MHWDKGQDKDVRCKYYLVIKELKSNALCFRVISGGPDFLSVKRISSRIFFESKMELSLRFPSCIARSFICLLEKGYQLGSKHLHCQSRREPQSVSGTSKPVL